MMANTAGPTRIQSFSIDGVPATLSGSVVALGNFDGLHRGHLALLEAAIADARRIGIRALVLTFEPHPRDLFRPDTPVFRLTSPEAKLRLLSAIGIDAVVVIPFDQAFAALTAEQFVAQVLVGRLSAGVVAVGYNFHFGHGRTGSASFLVEAGARFGFPVSIIGPIAGKDGVPYSATRIRDALEAGDVAEANKMLGYRWFVTATVISGDRRGRELGFPTANLRLAGDCRLRHGIYAVRVGRADGGVFDGVASFGRRPTFDNGAPLLEACLFDFAGDLYGEELTVTFIDWIRPELRFESVDALVARMTEDAAAARRILAEAGPGNALDQALSVLGRP
ncbi:MAG: bifunctional riboflavin kinase/FAD synthetase [Bauldia sp.]